MMPGKRMARISRGSAGKEWIRTRYFRCSSGEEWEEWEAMETPSGAGRGTPSDSADFKRF